MTPTREQLQSIEWAGADSSCPVCRVYGPGYFHANIDVFPHAPDCWLAAALTPPAPAPTIAARVRMAAERGCVYNVLVRGICERGTAGCDINHTPAPAPMPPIEKGDWVKLFGGVWEAEKITVWTESLRDEFITEIRKANGTVWTREPRA